MKVYHIILVIALSFPSLRLIAQQGQRPNIEQRVENEKARVLKKVTDLTEDQQLIFDQVYLEYGQAIKDAFEANSGDRQGMRESMVKIRKEKDDVLKEVLSESQYALYEEVMTQQRQNRRERRGDRNGRGGN